MNATVPLKEALPWSAETPRKILICDSIETDGSFLLHTFAGQVLKTSVGSHITSATAGRSGGSSHRLWWLTARPVTDRQVATALKKIGCDAAASYLRKPTGNTAVHIMNRPPLQITSLTAEIASKTLETDGPNFDGELYLKEIYKQIKAWAASGHDDVEATSKCWIFLDDVSSLASILGDEGLVYQFVDSIQSLATRTNSLGTVVRCSYELDQTLMKAELEEAQDKIGWLGAGGMAQKEETQHIRQTWIPWERAIESMDIVVDIVPLSSGYSREAHGRLVFSEYPGGRGWSSTATGNKTKQGSMTAPSASPWNSFVINYCLQDNGVRAIRLRESTGKT
jgi:hypothetical protein